MGRNFISSNWQSLENIFRWLIMKWKIIFDFWKILARCIFEFAVFCYCFKALVNIRKLTWCSRKSDFFKKMCTFWILYEVQRITSNECRIKFPFCFENYLVSAPDKVSAVVFCIKQLYFSYFLQYYFFGFIILIFFPFILYRKWLFIQNLLK